MSRLHKSGDGNSGEFASKPSQKNNAGFSLEQKRDSQRWVINIQREMEWLMEEVVSRKPPAVRFSPRTWQPSIDVYETENAVVVLVELAGIKEDEVEVFVENNMLTIRGERRDIKQGIKRTYSQMEILWGSFERGIALPVNVDIEQVEAFYEGGFLEITMSKQKNKRLINRRNSQQQKGYNVNY
ncbi:MAG: Hsp20/alpha crystallin family protein [Chloroflexota bacterium]|nr:Hsp20/alpha crystallin family protein [Chloroflexota bacterium]